MICLNAGCILFDRTNNEMNGISVYILLQHLLACNCILTCPSTPVLCLLLIA